MKKNLKKIITKIYINAKEKDRTRLTFRPEVYPVNWERAIKAIQALDKRIAFNLKFKPLMAEIYKKDLAEYVSAGHKLNTSIKKEMKLYAKEKAKELIKAELQAQAPAKQSDQE